MGHDLAVKREDDGLGAGGADVDTDHETGH